MSTLTGLVRLTELKNQCKAESDLIFEIREVYENNPQALQSFLTEKMTDLMLESDTVDSAIQAIIGGEGLEGRLQ